MKIFFSILLSVCFLNSFSQSDSVKHKFSVSISPLALMYPQWDPGDGLYFGDGFLFAYQPKQKISFELGGMIYNLGKVRWADLDNSGFIIRTGVKFNHDRAGQTEHPFYEILCFYRRMDFKDRSYHGDAGAVLETTTFYHTDLSDHVLGVNKIGDEIKNVICIESLWGSKYFLGKQKNFIFEYYGGFGIRLKYRELSITQAHILSPYSLSPVNPPTKETIISVLPSLHFGIKFGYSF